MKTEADELLDWLEANRSSYLQAQEILGQPSKMLAWLKSLEARVSEVMRYDPFVHPPHAAVGVVCSVRERLSGMFDDLDFIEEYEAKKEKLSRILNRDESGN